MMYQTDKIPPLTEHIMGKGIQNINVNNILLELGNIYYKISEIYDNWGLKKQQEWWLKCAMEKVGGQKFW